MVTGDAWYTPRAWSCNTSGRSPYAGAWMSRPFKDSYGGNVGSIWFAQSRSGTNSHDAGGHSKRPLTPSFLYPQVKVRFWLEQEGLPSVGRGLQNAGQTCYMNAILQALVHTKPLQNYLLSGEHSSTCILRRSSEFCGMCLFEKHARETLTGGRTPYYPRGMLRRMRCIGGKHLRVGRQEDAHEFLFNFLEALQTALLKQSHTSGEQLPEHVQRTTLVQQLFSGMLRSQVRCTRCSHSSSTYEPFLALSLEIKGVSNVEQALRGFVREETLAGENAYKCERCRRQVTAKKGLKVRSLPPVVIMHFKRFEYTFDGREKINDRVSYNALINLAPATTDPESTSLYRLSAVVVHAGACAESGHYFTYAKNASGWFLYNDEIVQPVSEKTVLQQQAYLLLYEAVDTGRGSAAQAPQVRGSYKRCAEDSGNLPSAKRHGSSGAWRP